MGVQRDIYRRIEVLQTRKTEAEASRKREELADWVGVYHRVLTDSQQDRKPPAPPAVLPPSPPPTSTGQP